MSSIGTTLWRGVTQMHVASYRLLKGGLIGKNTILLTTVGRKTGKERVTPLLTVKDGNNYVLIASYRGAEKNPAWYTNLKANPTVTLEDHGRTLTCIASTVSDEAEYKRLWALMVGIYPNYNSYQQRTARIIPVVQLAPISA